MRSRRHGPVAERLILACALTLAAWLLGRTGATAGDESRPLQLEVYINDVPTNKIGSFVQFSDQRLAARRVELAEVGIKAPGAADELVVIDVVPGIQYRFDERDQKIFFTLRDEIRVKQV